MTRKVRKEGKAGRRNVSEENRERVTKWNKYQELEMNQTTETHPLCKYMYMYLSLSGNNSFS